jgi:hypothetical protein
MSCRHQNHFGRKNMYTDYLSWSVRNIVHRCCWCTQSNLLHFERHQRRVRISTIVVITYWSFAFPAQPRNAVYRFRKYIRLAKTIPNTQRIAVIDDVMLSQKTWQCLICWNSILYRCNPWNQMAHVWIRYNLFLRLLRGRDTYRPYCFCGPPTSNGRHSTVLHNEKTVLRILGRSYIRNTCGRNLNWKTFPRHRPFFYCIMNEIQTEFGKRILPNNNSRKAYSQILSRIYFRFESRP